MAQTAASVRDIDGIPLPYPVKDSDVELNIDRIGDEGYAAFIEWMRKTQAELIEAAKAAGEAGPLDTSSSSPDSPA